MRVSLREGVREGEREGGREGERDVANTSTASVFLQECRPEQIFSESKFLRQDALLELVKSLTYASRGPQAHAELGTLFDEESSVFCLELLITVAIANR